MSKAEMKEEIELLRQQVRCIMVVMETMVIETVVVVASDESQEEKGLISLKEKLEQLAQ